MIFRVVLATLGLIAMSLSGNTQAGDLARMKTPTPFEAHYAAEYQGMRFEDAAIRRLERLDNGTYRHSYEAEHMVYFVREESILELTGCEARPLTYSSERGNLFRRKVRNIEFDWHNKVAIFDDEGHKGRFPLRPGIVDPMAARLTVACQADATPRKILLTETSDDRTEEHTYIVHGKVTLDTPQGKTEAIKVEPIHNNPKRKSLMWLSADNPELILKLWQKDTDGSIYLLELTSWKPLAAK